MSWTLTFTLPRTITVNLEFVPWLIVGYFFWGAVLSALALKAEKKAYSDSRPKGLDWILAPILGSIVWPGLLYMYVEESAEIREKYNQEEAEEGGEDDQ